MLLNDLTIRQLRCTLANNLMIRKRVLLASLLIAHYKIEPSSESCNKSSYLVSIMMVHRIFGKKTRYFNLFSN
jgi:hypothetical protein